MVFSVDSFTFSDWLSGSKSSSTKLSSDRGGLCKRVHQTHRSSNSFRQPNHICSTGIILLTLKICLSLSFEHCFVKITFVQLVTFSCNSNMLVIVIQTFFYWIRICTTGIILLILKICLSLSFEHFLIEFTFVQQVIFYCIKNMFVIWTLFC